MDKWWEREHTELVDWDIEHASCSCTLAVARPDAADCIVRLTEDPRRTAVAPHRPKLVDECPRRRRIEMNDHRIEWMSSVSEVAVDACLCCVALCLLRSRSDRPDRIRRRLRSIRHRRICSEKQQAEVSSFVSTATTTTTKTNETRDGERVDHGEHSTEEEEEEEGSIEALLLCSLSKQTISYSKD